LEPETQFQKTAPVPLPWSGPRPAIRDIAAEASHLRLEEPAQVRLHLQRGAPANLRHHVRRAVIRLAALVTADLGAFAVMRGLIRAVRDHAVLGDGLAGWLQAELPTGYLNNWQFAAALIIGLLVTGSYGPGDQRRDPRRLFFACALATALPLWAPLWTRGVEVLLVQYVGTVAPVWLGLVAERLTIDRIKAWVRPPERDALDTLFVGPASDCFSAAESPAFASGAEFRPIGFVDVLIPPAPGAVGHISDIELLLGASGAKVVVVCGYLSDHQFQSVVDAALAGGCEVLSVPRSVEVAGVHPTTVWRRGQPLVQLTAPGLKGPELALKRALDLVGAAIGLILLSPVLAVLAVSIKLGSPGPVFFTQQRVGRGGRLFRIIKLRTMMDGAEQHRDELLSQSVYSDPRLFKVPADPRMTKLGRWLRQTSLDELPQLANVLKGDMSLVGPRPPLPSEVALYAAHHYGRFDVKPGLTGPWQVAGRNQVTDFEKVVALESEYIRDWSLARDLAILLRTIPAVLNMRGAH
jgi:exopolysaccharide biosynthesis polyprenyl glycosylphosphotransferase